MDEIKFRFVFQHRKDKDYTFSYWTLDEILFGVGATQQPVRELIDALGKDGYLLVGKDLYTGLCDRHGKEIYEGDIAIATYGKWHEEPNGLTRICKVVYDGKTCSFRMAVNNSKVLVLFEDSRSRDIKIASNIHENPKLFGGQPE